MPPARLVGVPDVRQRGDFDCGLAATLAVLRTLKLTRSRADVMSALGTNQADGTHPCAIETYLRVREGLRVLAGEMEADDLAHHQRHGRPVVCLTRRDGLGHYVVSCGLHRGRVHYQDPADGPRCLALDDFLSLWWDEDKRSTYQRWGLAVWR